MTKKWCPWCDQNITERIGDELHHDLEAARLRIKELEAGITTAYSKTLELLNNKACTKNAEVQNMLTELLNHLNTVTPIRHEAAIEANNTSYILTDITHETVMDPDQWEEEVVFTKNQLCTVLRSDGCWTPCTIVRVTDKGYTVTGKDAEGTYEKFVCCSDVKSHLKAQRKSRFSSASKLRVIAAVKEFTRRARAMPKRAAAPEPLPITTLDDVSPADRKKLLQLESLIKAGTVAPALKFLLSTVVPLNVVFSEHCARTLLHTAVCGDSMATGEGPKVLKLLASKKALMMRDGNGDTPLLLAVRKGRVAMSATLVAIGADVTCVDANGLNALLIAVKTESWEKHGDKVIKMLITPDTRKARHNGDNALHLAIKEDHPTLVKALTDPEYPKRFDVEAKNSSSLTAVDLLLNKRERLAEWAMVLFGWGVADSVVSAHFPARSIAEARRRIVKRK